MFPLAPGTNGSLAPFALEGAPLRAIAEERHPHDWRKTTSVGRSIRFWTRTSLRRGASSISAARVNFLLHRKLDGHPGHHRAGDFQIIKTSDGYFFRHTNTTRLQCLHRHGLPSCHWLPQSVKGLTTLSNNCTASAAEGAKKVPDDKVRIERYTEPGGSPDKQGSDLRRFWSRPHRG